MRNILDVFGQSRLLTFDRDPGTREPTVELAHEALIQQWARLRGWIDAGRYDLRMHDLLTSAVTEWVQADRAEGFLLRDAKLTQFAAWMENTSLALTAAERIFLETSLAARKTRQLRARRTRLIVGALLVAATVISIGFAIFANEQRQQALTQASIGLAAQTREELAAGNFDLAVLLSLEALEYYPYTWQAESALADAVETYRPVVLSDAPIHVDGDSWWAVAWSPDGTRIGGGNIDTFLIVNPTTDEIDLSHKVAPARSLIDQAFFSAAWSPAPDRFALSVGKVPRDDADLSLCSVILVIDTGSGDVVNRLSCHEGPIWDVNWSLDGTKILSAGMDGTARIWDAETGREVLRFDAHDGPVNSAAWSPDGERAATASDDGTARIWDADTGQDLQMFEIVGTEVTGVDWSPDGSQIAASYTDGLVRIWQVDTGQQVYAFPGHTASVLDVDWSPTGDRIASLGSDGSARVWSPATGFQNLVLNARGGVWYNDWSRSTVAWSPEGDLLLVKAVYGAWIWNMEDVTSGFSSPFSFSVDAQWSPDGTVVAGTSQEAFPRVWDAYSGNLLYTLEIAWTGFLSWSPDGNYIAIPNIADGSATVWEVHSGRRVLDLSSDHLANHIVWPAIWSPDGSRIISSSYDLTSDNLAGDNVAIIWDALTGEERTILPNQDCHLHRPDWSADGNLIITGCGWAAAAAYPDGNSPAIIWDPDTGGIVAKLISDNGWTYTGEWSPDGKQIVTTHQDGTVRIWDATRYQEVKTLSGLSGDVRDAEWSPNGARIAAGDSEGKVTVWDVASGDIVLGFTIPQGDVLAVHWHPDGSQIILAGGFLSPLVRRAWESTEALIDYAHVCCVTRSLTPEERAQFGLPTR